MNSAETRALLVYYAGIELDNAWDAAECNDIIKNLKERGVIDK